MKKKTRKKEVEVLLQVLAIDSNFEPVTKMGFDYRQENVYPDFEAKGFGIVRCQGPLARRIYVAPAALRDDVVYMTGVGHGSYTVYTGDQYDPVFEVGQYQPAEAGNKIVHFLSCKTAAQLGPDFVRNGCLAYFGYDVNFTFNQQYADFFFECDSTIDWWFADGSNAGEVHQQTIDKYDLTIEYFEANGLDYLVAMMEMDRDHLCSPGIDARWGSVDARLC